VFCLLVVLVELSVLAKWLARKTPLRKPNRGEGIVSRKPRTKSAHDFLGLLYCFIVLLCICVNSCPYMIYYPTVMARYRLFVLKVSLNLKQTNKQCKNRPASFPGRMSYKATKPGLICVSYLSMFLIVLLFIRAPFYVLLVFLGMYSVFWLFWLSC